MFYELEYFKKGNDGLCGDDFNNRPHIDFIRSEFISSLSRPHQFKLPFSGNKVGEYSVLTMSNGDMYYISVGIYHKLKSAILNM